MFQIIGTLIGIIGDVTGYKTSSVTVYSHSHIHFLIQRFQFLKSISQEFHFFSKNNNMLDNLYFFILKNIPVVIHIMVEVFLNLNRI